MQLTVVDMNSENCQILSIIKNIKRALDNEAMSTTSI